MSEGFSILRSQSGRGSEARMADKRDTELRRSTVTDSVRERVWGRAAARCVLCSKWLIDEGSFWHKIPVGQIAHNVGATSGPNSPRGDSALTAEERALEENLLLLCYDCHKAIDSPGLRHKYTVQFLQKKKVEHERRVREVTKFPTLRKASVLRVCASIRGTSTVASPEQISDALLASGLTGMGADSRNGMFDIKLTQDESHEWAWEAAKTDIDRMLDRVYEAITAEDTSVITVFALAPVPILTYLGSRLDDKVEVVLFQRHRADSAEAWCWPDDAPDGEVFTIAATETHDDRKEIEDVIMCIDLSARILEDRIPRDLAGLPTVRIGAAGGTTGPDIIDSCATLREFTKTWRKALAKIESQWPHARRLHIFAAAPATAAIELGRHRMRSAHPDFILYQRATNATYEPVMEVAG